MSALCGRCGNRGPGHLDTGTAPPWRVCRRCGRAWAPLLRWWVGPVEGGLWQIHQVGRLPTYLIGTPLRTRRAQCRNLQAYIDGIRESVEESDLNLDEASEMLKDWYGATGAPDPEPLYGPEPLPKEWEVE